MSRTLVVSAMPQSIDPNVFGFMVYTSRFSRRAKYTRPASTCKAYNKRGYIPADIPPILLRLKMNAAPVLNYLAKDDSPSPSALGPIGMLRAFAESVGQKFIKGHVLGSRLCPERGKLTSCQYRNLGCCRLNLAESGRFSILKSGIFHFLVGTTYL